MPYVQISVRDESPLIGKTLITMNQNMGINLLICAVVRGGEAFVPKGDTVICKDDILYMTGAAEEFRKSFKKLKLPVKPLQSVMIAGGGRISYYLAEAILLKNRHGSVGKIPLMWLPEYTTFSSVEKHREDDE